MHYLLILLHYFHFSSVSGRSCAVRWRYTVVSENVYCFHLAECDPVIVYRILVCGFYCFITYDSFELARLTELLFYSYFLNSIFSLHLILPLFFVTIPSFISVIPFLSVSFPFYLLSFPPFFLPSLCSSPVISLFPLSFLYVCLSICNLSVSSFSLYSSSSSVCFL